MTVIRQGQQAALGITVDADNDVVILVIVSIDNDVVGVSMTPDVARAFGRAMRDMSREADVLYDELEDLDPEERQDRLASIINRYGSVATDQPPLS